jgi:hypothetical protein
MRSCAALSTARQSTASAYRPAAALTTSLAPGAGSKPTRRAVLIPRFVFFCLDRLSDRAGRRPSQRWLQAQFAE